MAEVLQKLYFSELKADRWLPITILANPTHILLKCYLNLDIQLIDLRCNTDRRLTRFRLILVCWLIGIILLLVLSWGSNCLLTSDDWITWRSNSFAAANCSLGSSVLRSFLGLGAGSGFFPEADLETDFFLSNVFFNERLLRNLVPFGGLTMSHPCQFGSFKRKLPGWRKSYADECCSVKKVESRWHWASAVPLTSTPRLRRIFTPKRM